MELLKYLGIAFAIYLITISILNCIVIIVSAIIASIKNRKYEQRLTGNAISITIGITLLMYLTK